MVVSEESFKCGYVFSLSIGSQSRNILRNYCFPYFSNLVVFVCCYLLLYRVRASAMRASMPRTACTAYRNVRHASTVTRTDCVNNATPTVARMSDVRDLPAVPDPVPISAFAAVSSVPACSWTTSKASAPQNASTGHRSTARKVSTFLDNGLKFRPTHQEDPKPLEW